MAELIELFSSTQTYLSLLTLTALEIVLGVDNILFISIVASRLPEHQRETARRLGLFLALFGRLVLLLSLSFVLSLSQPLFELFGRAFSGRDMVLLGGGLFLLYKSTQEIFLHLEVSEAERKTVLVYSFASAVFQILILDIVFSLDSIITAVGLVSELPIMALAIIIAVFVMMVFSRGIASFLERHPSMKVLGLAFLFLVAVLLVVESFGYHVPRGYVYFALSFSAAVEALNIWHRVKSESAKSAQSGDRVDSTANLA